MELYWLWKEIGENWMLTKTEIEYLGVIAKANEQQSMEEEAIMMFFNTPDSGGYTQNMTNTEIVNYIETKTKLKISPYKLGLNMKKLGYEKKNMKINGVSKLVYQVICKNEQKEDI